MSTQTVPESISAESPEEPVMVDHDAAGGKSLTWFLARLSAMTPGEVCARVGHKIQAWNWSNRRDWVAPRPTQIPPPDASWRSVLDQISDSERTSLIEQAERYVRGEYDFLGHTFCEPEMLWHRDVESGIDAPKSFALNINYRDTKTVGHIKNIWEKSRHQHLTVAAAAFALTGDDRFAALCDSQLRGWIRDNPPMNGVNWSNGLELGIRLISWVWIDRLLQDSDRHGGLFGDNGEMWSSVFWHQWQIGKRHSPGSSANNHLIGEMVGLFCAALAWPCFDESVRWAELAQQILQREIERQTFASGLNRELAFEYHLFTLELFSVAAVEAARYGRPFDDPFDTIMGRMIRAIYRCRDIGGNVPQYGDGDDATALRLRPDDQDRLDWLLDVGCTWVVPSDRSLQTSRPMQSLLMLPQQSRSEPTGLARRSQAFEDAGIYFMIHRPDTAEEIVCMADAGPLGYLSIAAHGHADALSFTLSVGGHQVLVDCGTFVYHGHPNWRRYFRGTRAHNTITIDGQDQAEGVIPFIWRGRVDTNVLQWSPSDDGGRLVAEHYGYRRLPGRPVHRRNLHMTNNRIDIQDTIQGSGRHHIDSRLHFSPACEVTIHQNLCNVASPFGSLRISLDKGLNWHLTRGGREGGWYSAAFGVCQPTTTLIGDAEVELPTGFNLRLEVHHED